MELLPRRHCLSADETLTRCRHDPVRALIDMEDFYAHTPVSLPPCSSRVWLELPTWGRVTLTQPEQGVIDRGWYSGATKPRAGCELAARHTFGPGCQGDEGIEMRARIASWRYRPTDQFPPSSCSRWERRGATIKRRTVAIGRRPTARWKERPGRCYPRGSGQRSQRCARDDDEPC